jgi:L-gulonolactone oxidase
MRRSKRHKSDMDGSGKAQAEVPTTDHSCTPIEVQNWKGSIHYTACHVIEIRSVDKLCEIVADPKYPAPVRAKGSHHSTTKCVVAERGTVLDMTAFNRIQIDEANLTVTMEAGALLIDAAERLAEKNLQFYVNIELGNLTAGSGACCATKEASFYSDAAGAYEFGQVSSYAIGFKVVQADGSILIVDESTNASLLPYMRSSYGMLGIVYEVTFRVKQRRPMAVRHDGYDVHEFAANVGRIVGENRSSMLYLFPHLNRVVVERRWEDEGTEIGNRILWRFRNLVWGTVSPFLGHTLRWLAERHVPGYFVIDLYYLLLAWALEKLVHAHRTDPADQIIRYPERGGYTAYTFSIWSFPLALYPAVIVKYFKFCNDFYREYGFRCDMLNVGYAEAKDESALFSYTRDGFSLTLDPVATGGRGWDAFLRKFNEFCIENGGKPLLNQTPHLEPAQVQRAFGPQIKQFQVERRQRDPRNRFYNEYFRHLFEDS